MYNQEFKIPTQHNRFLSTTVLEFAFSFEQRKNVMSELSANKSGQHHGMLDEAEFNRILMQ